MRNFLHVFWIVIFSVILVSTDTYAQDAETCSNGVDYSSAMNDYGGQYNASNFSNGYAFVALKEDGSITTWGDFNWGGSGAPTDAGYTKIYSTENAFAALKEDGSIRVWSNDDNDISGVPTDTGYTKIYSTAFVFVALKEDGSIVSWEDYEGFDVPNDSGYKEIYSNSFAFAALKEDGSITAWGIPIRGGSGAPTDVGYKKIYSTENAFAALKEDGSITAWGMSDYGGSGAPTDAGYTRIYSTRGGFAALKEEDGSITAWGSGSFNAPTDNGYIKIYSTSGAFAALKEDGSITAWGDSNWGGSGAPTDNGYIKIYSTSGAFAAIKADGSIASWGSSNGGGSGAPTDTGYIKIYSTGSAFAAIKADGSITSWGNDYSGGLGAPTDSGYTKIYSTSGAFIALKEDGSITAWGDSRYGGTGAPTGTGYRIPYGSESCIALTEMSLIGTTSDTTPNYTFNSSKAGTITYSGDCSSTTTEAIEGNNTITFNSLSEGTHSNCEITVTDSFGNFSQPLKISEFTITTGSVDINGQFVKILESATIYSKKFTNSTDDRLKVVPKDWILKVKDTYNDTKEKDGYIWWEVKDKTDELEGWIVAKKADGSEEYLEYDESKQDKWESLVKKDEDISNGTKEKVIEISKNEFDKFDFSIKNSKVEKKINGYSVFPLIEALMEQEGAINIFNKNSPLAFLSKNQKYFNELVTYDCGRGIGQITKPNDYVGKFSGVKCYCGTSRGHMPYEHVSDKKLKDIDSNFLTSHNLCREYKFPNCSCNSYTNTTKGYETAIQDKYGIIKEKMHYAGNSNNTSSKTKWLGTIWRYNGKSPGCKKASNISYVVSVVNKLSQNQKENFGLNKLEIIDVCSPVDLKITDNQGRVTGVVDGKIVQEIPDVIYDEEMESILVVGTKDNLKIQVTGNRDITINDDAYGFKVTNVENGEVSVINTEAAPVKVGEVHEYNIDWDKVKENKADAVEIKVDKDGDGTFEKIIKTTAEFDGTVFEGGTSIETFTKTPIFRLYNKRTGAQLYVRGQADRDKILAKYKDFEFSDGESIFYASLTKQSGLTPIYRLYNTRTGAQLYTRGESDKNKILTKYKDFEFTDGEPAFWASLTEQPGLTPIFRLYNTRTGAHLYTRGEIERDKILTKYKDFEFTDGAPAFYTSLTN